MNKKIAITNDLADLFIAQSIYENNCLYLNKIGVTSHADYMLENLRQQNINLGDLFSMLTHLMLLYDNIELPIINTSYSLCGGITSIAKINNTIPLEFFDNSFGIKELSHDLVFPLKPFVINACMNFSNPKYFTKYAIHKTGSVENFYGYIFDLLYGYDNAINADSSYYQRYFPWIYLHKDADEEPFFGSERASSIIAIDQIKNSVQNLLLIEDLSKKGPCDFYTPSLSNLHTATNTHDAYCIVKNQISMILDEQPAFKTMTEILAFREKKYRDIVMLRNEVSQLETLVKQGENEKAIEKAINDVRRANQSLLKNTPAKKAARLATYLSVPISFLEMLLFGTSFSIIIGVVGTAAQFIVDSNDSKNNWLFVAR